MISFSETVLASRTAASSKRESVQELLTTQDVVQFDMENVSAMSSSYADELFGILYLKLEESFFDRIIFSKASELVIESLASAIAIRQQSHSSKAA